MSAFPLIVMLGVIDMSDDCFNTDKVGIFVQINPRPLCDVEWKDITDTLIGCGIDDIRLSKPRNYAAHGVEERCLTLFSRYVLRIFCSSAVRDLRRACPTRKCR